MIKLMTLALALSASCAFADTFVGTQARINTECKLIVQRTYFMNEVESAANFRADVTVEFWEKGHGANHLETLDFTLAPSARANELTGTAQRDTLIVALTPASTHLEAPVSYGVRYLHGNHMHSAQCQRLAKVTN